MRPFGSISRALTRGAVTMLVLALPLVAQQPVPATPEVAARLAAARATLAAESFVAPSGDLARLANAPRHLSTLLGMPSPDRRHFLKQQSEGQPSMAVFAKPHVKFAGLQIDPAANRVRSMTTRGNAGLELIDARTGAVTRIAAPAGATVSNPAWSPDGAQVAYFANFETASHIFVADVATGRARQVTRTAVLATLVSSLEWTADGRQLVTVLIPANRGPVPAIPDVPPGPKVQLWMDGGKSSQRMHASLMDTPAEFAQLEYYATGQLAAIDVQTRAVRTIGAPAMIRSVSVSPDGQHFRVTTMLKPFSYVVPWSSFGTVEEIWDGTGRVLAEITKRPLREVPDTATGPGGQAAGGKRGLAWMPQGAGMYYLDAAPAPRGADSAAANGAGGARPAGQGTAGRPDRLIQWLPPFGPGDTTVLYRADGPVAGVLFSDDARTLFVGTNRSGVGEVFAVRLDQPDRKHTIVRQRGYVPSLGGGGPGFGFGGGGGAAAGNDSVAFYSNPGNLMGTRGSRGGTVAMVSSDGAVFLSGTQYFPDWQQRTPRAFVDKVTIEGGAKSRIFEGAPGMSETIVAALDPDFRWAVVNRDSPTMVPDSWLRDMSSGQLTNLTNNQDYTPEFTRLQRRQVWVTRADGIRFLVRVTLPADYREGTRLPGMFWFYPGEYTDQAGYDRRLRTEHVARFPTSNPRSIEFLATQGYAVANFDPPIIGPQGRMNDNYVPDLRMNLLAVIDELDKQGLIDRQRLGLGGHSYGAFSTANAMVHTPFFRAGIAGAGMYNRTLTPNGFQTEQRDLWSGQQTYLEMSPMLSVDQMQGALLLYHGLDDQNVGTSPISSIRMMQALRAQGKTASMFLYPFEDHGPATLETNLDLWARWTAWLDIYVKFHGVQAPKEQRGVADVSP